MTFGSMLRSNLSAAVASVKSLSLAIEAEPAVAIL